MKFSISSNIIQYSILNILNYFSNHADVKIYNQKIKL